MPDVMVDNVEGVVNTDLLVDVSDTIERVSASKPSMPTLVFRRWLQRRLKLYDAAVTIFTNNFDFYHVIQRGFLAPLLSFYKQ